MNVGPRVLAVLYLWSGALLHAQSASYLFGRVIDPTNALVPGASVTIVNQDTGFRRLTATGQGPNANFLIVDGASANTGVTAGGLPAQATGGVLPAMSAFGSLDSLLPVEAIDEVRVQTANTPGDLGRLPGASVSLSSRS